LKRSSAGVVSIPNPNEGAPFVSTALPFRSRIFVAVSSETTPVALRTFGSERTF
jgi:hypothetical protein